MHGLKALILGAVSFAACRNDASRTSKLSPQSPQAPSLRAAPPPASESGAYAITIKLERVVAASQYEGPSLVVDDDPRFVIVGFVTESEPPLFAPDVRQAFAVHDTYSLGLNGWRPGDTADFALFGARDGGATRWRLVATKPH